MNKKNTLLGMRIVILGGNGFLGKHLVQACAKQGAQIIIPLRRSSQDAALRPLGFPGQIMPVLADIRRTETLLPLLKDADAVVNLVGILFPKKNARFDDIHHKSVARLAKAAYAEKVKKFIHVSAIGADPASVSHYARSKGKGEQALLKAFPGAMIVRPSIIFGPGDSFFMRFAGMVRISPFLPLIGGGKTRFQPVYVGDVAQAITVLLGQKRSLKKTYVLGGPEILTFRRCLELMLEEIGVRRFLLSIPFSLAMVIGFFVSFLPNPPLTYDQVRLLKLDNVVGEGADGFGDLGINPISISAILPIYMDAFRRAGRFT